MKRLYSCVGQNAQHESLKSYLQKDFPQNVFFNKRRKMYQYGKSGYAGLISALRCNYYPYYRNTKRRKNTKKKGSNKELGKRIDNEVSLIVQGHKKKKFHAMTEAVMEELNKRGHILQCAQLPVYIKKFKRITQADFITLNKTTGRLHMWELKTGYTPGMYTTRGKGHFLGPLKGVKCNKYGIWELQRYWTARALKEAGLEISASNVIQVYRDTSKKKYVVKVLDNLEWLQKFESQ